MSGRRMVAVAIAVGNAEGLEYLPAAVNCAVKVDNWATALGYESFLVTDAEPAMPVTVDRLREVFEAILGDPRPIHRMIIYFAGHGMIKELEVGLWFLSDWKNEGLVVSYELLRRRLSTFNINQIAIFSDACRSLPRSVFDLDLEERGVLAPGATRTEPAIDKFVAASDGTASFALPGESTADDFCIFSGVLLEALWGLKADAFSTVVPDAVTSGSLGAYLKREVPAVAKRYGLRINPSVVPAFPENDNTYFRVGSMAGPPQRPKLFDWPDPAPRSESPSPPVQVASGLIPRPQPLSVRLAGQHIPHGVIQAGSGLSVGREEMVQQIWTARDVGTSSDPPARAWAVFSPTGARRRDPSPILLEFVSGRFAALTVLPGFITAVIADGRGVSGVAYRPAELYPPPVLAAELYLDALERGPIRAEAVTEMAAVLRAGKHIDPMLGVFAAYLYDSIGDLSNIRRMAYFYAAHGEPIPYDIALLARIPSTLNDGVFTAKVSPVEASTPRSAAERERRYTHEATPEIEGKVGGAWPWLRQGWALLDDPNDAELGLIQRGLSQLARHLTTARFTTLDDVGGRALAEMFDLQPTAIERFENWVDQQDAAAATDLGKSEGEN